MTTSGENCNKKSADERYTLTGAFHELAEYLFKRRMQVDLEQKTHLKSFIFLIVHILLDFYEEPEIKSQRRMS